MKKDKKWLKEAIGNLDYTKAMFVYDGVSYIDTAVSVMQVYDLIDELDEPEVLSQEWIDNNSINASHDGVTDEYVHIDDLKNLLVTKQELPVIPKSVADWWELDGYSVTMYGELRIEKKHKLDLITKFYEKGLDGYLSKVEDWIHKNHSSFLDLVNEKPYEVEKEKLYRVEMHGTTDVVLLTLEGGEYYFDEPLDYVGERPNIRQEFTESEIKAFDERYWQFTVEVEYEKLDALYQRDQGVGVPYPETDTNVGYKPPPNRLVERRENKVRLTKQEIITYLNDILPPDIQMNVSAHCLATDVHEFEIKLDGVAKR